MDDYEIKDELEEVEKDNTIYMKVSELGKFTNVGIFEGTSPVMISTSICHPEDQQNVVAGVIVALAKLYPDLTLKTLAEDIRDDVVKIVIENK